MAQPRLSLATPRTIFRQKLKTTITPGFLLLISPGLVILTILLMSTATRNTEQQFVYLAQAFLHGHANFQNLPANSLKDVVPWHDMLYWALGPFPAIVLIPFVALANIFGAVFHQAYLVILMVLGLLWLITRLGRRLKYEPADSLVLSLGFVLGSCFIGLIALPTSWYFSQVVCTLLLFWALYEFFGKKRWWLLGVICGCLLLSRISAAAIAVFFLLEAWYGRGQPRQKRLSAVLQVALPLFAAVCLQSVYNFVRFHSLTEQGYSHQMLTDAPLIRARSYGLFSLVHVPGNLYYMFLSGPLPVFRDGVSHVLKFPFITLNRWGMSLFLTSPYLLYLFSLKKKAFDKQSVRLLISAAVSAVLVITYYGIGWTQFGYRYALDFLPAVFVFFMLKYRQEHQRLSGSMKAALLGSGVLNFYLLILFLWPGVIHG